MGLSSEDALRLNVMLASNVQAIRIDEAVMTAHGLSEHGESTIRLNPTCREDRYLRLVREAISSHVLGSPGGYPVFLGRWTRMGQTRDENLAQLLKLGEPEAVSAVVHARGLTKELARRAWWAAPSSENARSMLQRREVAEAEIGRVLASYLVEHLPFETDPSTVVATVRSVLQPGLLDAEARADLWRQGQRKSPYHVGFLLGAPDDLPAARESRADAVPLNVTLEPLAAAGNPFAQQMQRLLSGPGQSFLSVVCEALNKVPDQEVVLLLFEALAAYFAPVSLVVDPDADMQSVLAEIDNLLAGHTSADAGRLEALHQVLRSAPELRSEVRAMLFLARLGYPAVRAVFAHSTAVGALMRRKLQPLTTLIFEQLQVLQGQTR